MERREGRGGVEGREIEGIEDKEEKMDSKYYRGMCTKTPEEACYLLVCHTLSTNG